MKHKLYANIRRMTNVFCIGILCVTLSVLTLRLTVFSDMATILPQKTNSHILTSEKDGYKLNGRIYFPTVDSKGDVFITNVEGNAFIIKVSITLAESEDSILSTGFINPGVSMDSAKLNPTGQKLADGVYDCVAEITAHDPDSFKQVGSAKETVQVYIGERPQSDSDKSKANSSSSKADSSSSKGDTSGDASPSNDSSAAFESSNADTELSDPDADSEV